MELFSMDKIYVLINQKGQCLDIATSKENLAKIADFWIQANPQELLSYTEYLPNRQEGANGWDWVYIPLKGYSPKRLAAGGGAVPMKKYWGHNLLTLPKLPCKYPECASRWEAMRGD